MGIAALAMLILKGLAAVVPVAGLGITIQQIRSKRRGRPSTSQPELMGYGRYRFKVTNAGKAPITHLTSALIDSAKRVCAENNIPIELQPGRSTLFTIEVVVSSYEPPCAWSTPFATTRPGARSGGNTHRKSRCLRHRGAARCRRRDQPPLWSSTLAPDAWVLIASMPFSALAFVSYPWLAAMISPFGALR
jgi:hypothetical protein